LILTLLWAFSCASALKGQVQPLPQAHAHNDYRHARPLLDALSHGFCSVEADVFLIGGELYVAHTKPRKLRADRSLRALYLEPLRLHIEKNGWLVYPGYDGPFYLMIDIKRDGEAVYPVLKAQLQPYAETFREAGVTILLSGNRPVRQVLEAGSGLIALDGRPGDLGKGIPASLMPVVSDRYGRHFSWRGRGEMPPAEQARLRQLSDQIHAEGKKLRLWASPEKEKVWASLLESGADFINTDRLSRLRWFLDHSVEKSLSGRRIRKSPPERIRRALQARGESCWRLVSVLT